MNGFKRKKVPTGALSLLLLVSVASPVSAEIKTRVLPNGTVEIYNDGGGVRPPAAPPAAPPIVSLVATPRSSWDRWIQEASDLNSLDPKLLRSVIQVESAFNARAVSREGARGLMQLMPATARELGVADSFDPQQSILGGARYLKQMMDEFGRIELALAGYNAGPGAVRRYKGIPPYMETRDYVRKVMSLYRGVAPVLSEPLRSVTPGRKVYLRVGPDNKVVMTTSQSRE